MRLAVETRDLFRAKGLDSAILSGGSTGTYNIDSELPGGIELQAGSYVYMDNGYRAIGGRDGELGLRRLRAQPDRAGHRRQRGHPRPRDRQRRDQGVRHRLGRQSPAQGSGGLELPVRRRRVRA